MSAPLGGDDQRREVEDGLSNSYVSFFFVITD